MIVITGPGRSGTSVVAHIYAELGLNPGGPWLEHANAGFENKEVVALNEAIAAALGVWLPTGRPVSGRRVVRATIHRIPGAVRRVRQRQERSEQVELIRWERIEDVVDQYREQLLDVSARTPVVKDPRFCWTLPVWLEAGCDIGHVLLCVRSLRASARSRTNRRMVDGLGLSALTNVLTYGLGVCVAATIEYDVSRSLARFPDFVDDPESLYRAARFPRPVTLEEFQNAFAQVVMPEKVNHGR